VISSHTAIMLQPYVSCSFLGAVNMETQWDKYNSSIFHHFPTYLPLSLHGVHWISTSLHPSNHQKVLHHIHFLYIFPKLPSFFSFWTIYFKSWLISICFQIHCCLVVPIILYQQIGKGLIRGHWHVWHFQLCAAIPPCINTNHFWYRTNKNTLGSLYLTRQTLCFY